MKLKQSRKTNNFVMFEIEVRERSCCTNITPVERFQACVPHLQKASGIGVMDHPVWLLVRAQVGKKQRLGPRGGSAEDK